MDIIVSGAYLSGMLVRLVSIFAILAIAVVTTISAAHAARMDVMQAGHATRMSEMLQASASDHRSCDGGGSCGSADAVMCKFVCAGLSVMLTIPRIDAGHAIGFASHDVPVDAIHLGRVPGLNERPPKHRLL